MASKVSVLIPARGEPFLQQTIADLLAHATGEIQIIAVLDGWWPNPPLKDDPRVIILHWGQSKGMRPSINAAAQIANGDYLMKIDAHCLVGPGFDTILKADCDKQTLVVPRRYSLDADHWAILNNGKVVDAHYLSYPFIPDHAGGGLHGTVWKERASARKDVLVDDEMSSQGSCWFMHREHWNRIGPMQIEQYGNFIQEFQELGGKTWLGGGRVVCNKKTFYAHLHKGKEHGRGYHISRREMSDGARFAVDWWLNDRWPDRVHDLKWLVERFWPVPTWPKTADGALDWDTVMRDTAVYTKKYQAGEDCGF